MTLLEVKLLPILKNNAKQTGVMVKNRKPDSPEKQPSKNEDLEVCAKDIMHAINTKDIKGLAEAIRAAFQVLESEPHEEGPHIESEPHSYDAQNQKAYKQE